MITMRRIKMITMRRIKITMAEVIKIEIATYPPTKMFSLVSLVLLKSWGKNPVKPRA